MAERKITDKEAKMLARWERFCSEQSGVYPATVAAVKLRMTTQGVFQAAERGWIAFFQIGRDRWYSRRDVARYWEHRMMKKICPRCGHLLLRIAQTTTTAERVAGMFSGKFDRVCQAQKRLSAEKSCGKRGLCNLLIFSLYVMRN